MKRSSESTMSEYDKWEAVLPEADQGNISVAANGREVSIVGSQDSLTSLAIQLLSLAQG